MSIETSQENNGTEAMPVNSSSENTNAEQNQDNQASTAQPAPEAGDHYIVDGALFKCSNDSTGGTVISQMKSSNKSVYAQDKPLVTDKDKTFSGTFGTCLAKPTTNGFAPCCCNAEWILDNTIDTKKNANLPTEKSKLICSAGGGQITCIFHGQKKGVTAGDISNAKIETLSNLPFAFVMTFPTLEDLEDKKEASKVNSIKASKKRVRIGEEITFNIFSDNDKTKELNSPNYANFAITKTKEVKKETGKGKSARTVTETQIEKLTIYKHVYPPFKIKLDEAGKYCIEAGSDGMLNGIKTSKVSVIGYNNLDSKKPLQKGNNIPMYKNCAEEVEVISNNSIVGIEKKGDYKEIDETETVGKKEVKKRIAYIKQGKELTLTPKFLLDFDKKWEEIGYSVLKRNGDEWIEDKDDWKVEGQSLKLTPSAAEVNYQIKALLYQKSENQDIEKTPVSEETVLALSYNEAVLYAYVPGRSQKDNKNIVLRRPDETLIFTVKTQSATLSDDDMSKIIWTVKKGDEIVESNIKGRMILYKFKTPGKYKIIANLSDLKLRNGGVSESVINNWDEMMLLNTDEQTKNALNADSQNGINKEIDSQKGGKVSPIDPAVIRKSEISHTINISHNEVTKISLASTNGRNYVGVRYPITLSYLFGSADYDELKAIELTCEGADTDLLRNHKIFKADKPGEYKIIAKLNDKQCEQTITIMDSTFSTWEFCDSKNKKIDTIGKDMKFGIRGCVPAWSVVSGDEKKQNRTIRISLFHYEIALCSFSTELDDNGGFKVDGIDVNKDVIENALKYVPKYDSTSDFPIHFAVYHYPSDIVTGLSETKGGFGKRSICSNLNVTCKPYISGYFADKDGNRLVNMLTYEDEMNVHLRMLNTDPEKLKKLRLRVYENMWGFDPLVYEATDITLDADGIADIAIEIKNENIKSDKPKDEKVKGINNEDIEKLKNNKNSVLDKLKIYNEAELEKLKIYNEAELNKLKYAESKKSKDTEKKETDSDDSELPRLFFFMVVESDDHGIVEKSKWSYIDDFYKKFAYPPCPGDLYDMNARKLNELYDQENGVLSSDDNEAKQKSKIRNYYYQLKLISKKADNSELAKTYSQYAEAVVGEDWKEGKMKNKEYAPCPHCSEESTKMYDKVKKYFDKKSHDNLKIICDTYCKYMKALRMDTCWIKAHFFAQISVETQDKSLKPTPEVLNYDRNQLENTFQSRIFVMINKDTPKKDKNENRIYKSGLKGEIEKIYAIEAGPKRREAIANFVYKDTNGNNGIAGYGHKYRGGGYIQVTGKGNYDKVYEALKTYYKGNKPITFDLIDGAEKLSADIELSTLASMIYLYQHNIYANGHANGQMNEDVISRKVGTKFKIRDKKDEKGNTIKDANGKAVPVYNYDDKRDAFDKLKEVFKVDDCTWGKVYTGTEDEKNIYRIDIDDNLSNCNFSQIQETESNEYSYMMYYKNELIRVFEFKTELIKKEYDKKNRYKPQGTKVESNLMQFPQTSGDAEEKAIFWNMNYSKDKIPNWGRYSPNVGPRGEIDSWISPDACAAFLGLLYSLPYNGYSGPLYYNDITTSIGPTDIHSTHKEGNEIDIRYPGSGNENGSIYWENLVKNTYNGDETKFISVLENFLKVANHWGFRSNCTYKEVKGAQKESTWHRHHVHIGYNPTKESLFK